MRLRGDVEIAFGSVKGPVRTENQDDFIVYEPTEDTEFERDGRLIAVADGMGGGPAGGEASRLVLRSLVTVWVDAAGQTPDARLEAGWRRACDVLDAEARRDAALIGMGSTLTAINLRGLEVRGLHAGDSRCLLVHDGHGRWLTDLHVSPADGSSLTKAVVAGEAVPGPDSFEATLDPGDCLLLMTDGFWRAVGEEECIATAAASAPHEAVAQLLDRAQLLDGADNATLVVVCCRDTAHEPEEVDEVDAGGPARLESKLGSRSRIAIVWPWVLLLTGIALGVLAIAFRR